MEGENEGEGSECVIIDFELLKRLDEGGIVFSVPLTYGWINIRPEEVQDWLNDPGKFEKERIVGSPG